MERLSSAEPRQRERRRLWDRRCAEQRRSSDERRHGERRSRTAPASAAERRNDADRRAGERRRVGDRRSRSERRHPRWHGATPIPYAAEVLEELQQRFTEPGPIACPACGSHFTLGPVQQAGETQERLVLCMGCGRAAVVQNAHAARVLVISGETPLRGLLREMLAQAGHEVVEVDDAAVGLEAYRVVPADVVLMDVVSTGRLAAPAFLQQLRTEFPAASVVAVAGRASYEGVDPTGVVEGLANVRAVRVPVSREALLATIREARG